MMHACITGTCGHCFFLVPIWLYSQGVTVAEFASTRALRGSHLNEEW